MGEYFDFKNSMISGMRWFSLAHFLNYILQFIITIFLARLLFPADFGIINIALVINNLVVSIRDLGLDAAIVQKKEINQDYLSTVFWLNVGMSLALFILVVSFSKIIAGFFNNSDIYLVILCLAVKFAIDSLGTLQIAFLKNNLLFGKVAAAEILEVLSYGLIAVFLALKGFRVWSLVFGYLGGSLLKTVLLWGISSWRPVFRFCWESFKELFKFGRNVAGFNITHFFSNNLDFFLIGKLLGMQALGFYSMMYNIAYFPRLKISFIISKVAFPVFSKIQGDVTKMREEYLKLIKYTALISFPLLFGLMVLAYPLIKVFFGAKWLPIVGALKIFCIAGLASCLTALTGIIFLSSGYSGSLLLFSLINLSTLLMAFFLGFKHGLAGLAMYLSLQAVLMNIIVQKMINRIIHMKFGSYIRCIFPIFLSAFFMMSVLTVILRSVFSDCNDMVKLIAGAAAGASLYILFLYLLEKEVLHGFNKLFLRMAGLQNE